MYCCLSVSRCIFLQELRVIVEALQPDLLRPLQRVLERACRDVPEAPAQGPALDVLEEHLELGAFRAQRIRERLERPGAGSC